MFSIRIFRLKKNFSTDRFSSVLDKPKIKSPFDNPQRTLTVYFIKLK